MKRATNSKNALKDLGAEVAEIHKRLARTRDSALARLSDAHSKANRGSRSAKRVRLQTPLIVTGLDKHGTAFVDRVMTENVSEDGGCVVINRDLRRNEPLKIEAHDGTRFTAKVRWCVYYIWQDTRRVGFQLDVSSKNGWVIGASTE
jgi:hypothetical protein